jgi:F420H(2)-dependent quinone reductase
MPGGKARLPPRWFIVTFWHVHRRIVRASGGRRGCGLPALEDMGLCGSPRRGGEAAKPRSVILGYYEDGPNLVSMAMNGWARPSQPGG